MIDPNLFAKAKTRTARIEIDWADGTHAFRLAFRELIELDEKRQCGPFELLNRIQAGTLDAKIVNIDAAVIKSGTINVARIGDATLGFAKIANDIQSTNYVAGSAGWKIDKTGQMEMNNATFRGTIDVKNSTSGERLEITNNVIRVYSAGVLRVKIGNLNA